jgi:polysaccharide export outer membrane protein
MKTVGFIGILVIILSLCRPAAAQDYKVGEGDVLQITVYDHPDLTTVARIGSDGTIIFPLIGQVKVSDLSVAEVSKKIAHLLSQGYIVYPQVTAIVQEFRSQRVTVMGEVKNPGLYELKGYTTFLEVLLKAGDLTKDAGDTAIIKRRPDSPGGKRKVITIDLRRLIEKGETSLDVPVVDGDSIYIPKAGVFYVTGEVKRPDSYKLEEGTTVLKAVTMAGGFTDKASTGRVKIIRMKNGKEKIMEKVKMGEPILPDDVIVVPESFF